MAHSLKVMGGIGLILALVTLSACPAEEGGGGGLLGPQHFPSMDPAGDGIGADAVVDAGGDGADGDGADGDAATNIVGGIYSGYNLDGYFHIPLVAGADASNPPPGSPIGEPAEDDGGSSEPGEAPVVEPPPLPDSVPQGIGVTSIKRVHLMDRDNYYPPAEKLATQQAVANIALYRAVWAGQLVAYHHPQAWQVLRADHQETLMFHTVSGATTRSVDENPNYFDYDYIHNNHPEWFLLRDVEDPGASDPTKPENRIRWEHEDSTDPNYYRYFVDVGNPEFRAWAVARLLEKVSGAQSGISPGFDGIGLDNVTMGIRGEKFFAQRAPNWKYAGNPADWTDAYLTYLNEIKTALNAAGYLLLVNHTLDYSDIYREPEENWQRLVNSVNAVMTEQLWHRGEADDRWIWQGEDWEAIIARHEMIQDAGLLSWTVTYPVEEAGVGYWEHQYAYCSWLMRYEPGLSVFFSSRGDPSYANPEISWYNDYTLPIGTPTSVRYKRGACWVRDFENARVYVNISDAHQSLSLSGGPWYDSGTGLPVESAEIPALSGLILLKGLP